MFQPLWHTGVMLNLGGEWTGFLYQDAGGLSPSYAFEINIEQDESRISGTSHIAYLNDSTVFGDMTFSGVFQNGILTFQEVSILSQNPPPNSRWCLKQSLLVYINDGRSGQLSGAWVDPDCAPGGHIELTRIIP